MILRRGSNFGLLLYGDVYINVNMNTRTRRLKIAGLQQEPNLKSQLTLYTQQKSYAQVGVRVNSVLIRNDCIKCYISLFKETILQQFDAF